MKTTKPLHTPPSFAACTFEIQAPDTAIQLLPTGAFKARDGRPHEVPSGHWYIDAQIAAKVIAKAAARVTAVVIDYEHQTLKSAENGLPAPAAAWFNGTNLEWREGQGLFATSVDWTEKAAAMVAAKEYRYLSPVFSYDPKSGEVLDVLHVALTNYPALDGMASLPALAAARFELAAPAAPSVEETPPVDREQLIELLALSSDASDEDIENAITGLKADAGKTQELQQALADASSAAPDPSQYVPIEMFENLKQNHAALKTTQSVDEVDSLIQAGLADGRLLPMQESWARGLGNKDVAALKGYLETTPVIPALKSRQTEGVQPVVPSTAEELSTEALAACKQLNVSPEDYLATLKGEQQ